MSKTKSKIKKAAKASKSPKPVKPLPELVVDENGHASIQEGAEPEAVAGESKKAAKVPKEKAPREDLCVFALRLTTAERDALHRAAGPAKASRFARALLVAAASGDEAELKNILKAVGGAER